MSEATQGSAEPAASPGQPPKRERPVPGKFPRRRSGTAKWHVSSKAVDITVPEIYGWTDQQAREFLIEARWGGRHTVRCPHCGTVSKHYSYDAGARWKCITCKKSFSVTSQTVFANRKLKLQELIASALMWVNSSAGQPALELKRHIGTSYNTAFTLQHKLREALLRGYNVGLLSGDLEMDGAHQSGYRAAEKRGRPQVSPKIKNASDAEVKAMVEAAQAATPPPDTSSGMGHMRDEEYGARLPKDRRILVSVRKRSGIRGRGAVATRVAVGLVETKPVAAAILQDYVAVSESTLNTDTAPAYEN